MHWESHQICETIYISALVILLFFSTIGMGANIDNPIFCPEVLPEPELFDWPETAKPLAEFNSLDELCAYRRWPHDSVGCWCMNLSGPRRCDLENADPILWAYTPLRKLCEKSCKCPLEGLGEHDMSNLRREKESVVGSYDPSRDIDFGYGSSSSEAGDASAAGSDADGDYMSDGGYSGDSFDSYMADPLPIMVRPRSCGRSCTNYKCASRDRGCRCIAKPQSVSNGIWSLYGCANPQKLLPKRRRRSLESDSDSDSQPELEHNSLQWPCPCNGTYVSQACCDAEDGLVWEGREKWLGRLDENEL